MKALFLGAGASYDFGMPLVWELTAELRNWLTPEKIDWLNDQWRTQGGGRSDATLELVKSLIENRSLHYEAILGAIEVAINREKDRSEYQELHGMYSWLLQMIYHMLNERQVRNTNYIEGTVKDYYGIKKLADENRPLWVFSLNHDVNLEIIAKSYGIPVKSGFTHQTSFPERSEQGDIIGRIKFERISRSEIEKNEYDFFKNDEFGINLIKLHGALDIFAQGDDLNYLKILPDEESATGYTNALYRANNYLRSIPFIPCSNEVAYTDDAGEIQFLRRTLLSGAHKFTGKISQLAPPEFLGLFKSYINFSDELICVGYGFGDSHIDSRIRDWLSFSRERKLTVVNPGFSKVGDIASTYLHLSSQIEFMGFGFTEYILGLDSSNDDVTSKVFRKLRSKGRIKVKERIENGI